MTRQRLHRRAPEYMRPNRFYLIGVVSIKEAAERLDIPHARLRRWWDTQKDTWPKPLKVYGNTPVFFLEDIQTWYKWWLKEREHG